MYLKTFAIDPGTTQSAWVIFESGTILEKGLEPNEELRWRLWRFINEASSKKEEVDVAIEMIQSYGMPVGREIFETCLWVGRYVEIVKYNLGREPHLYSRTKIKAYVTGSSKAKDKDVRQALMTRFGGAKKGEPLEGVSKDIWSALAVAVYHYDGSVLGGWVD